MHVVLDKHSGKVRKHAESEAERERLTREAEVLRVAAHPGVVQILKAAGQGAVETLVLRKVNGSSVLGCRGLAPLELSWVGAALATTIADLHEIGVVHRALLPEHVLIDADGRPVLCGFGSALYTRGTHGARPGDRRQFEEWRRLDVIALADLLLQVGAGSLGSRSSKALVAAANGRGSGGLRGKPVDARYLARALAAAARDNPEQRLGSRCRAQSEPSARSAGVHRRGTRPVLAVAAAVALTAVAATLWPSGSARHAMVQQEQHGALSSTVRPCPGQDEGCLPMAARAGMIERGFRLVGTAGVMAGVMVVGRWDCRPTATPAVLDPRTGNIWVFDSWPANGQTSVARFVTTSRGASTLKVLPGAARGGCDRIEIFDRRRPLGLADPQRPSQDAAR